MKSLNVMIFGLILIVFIVGCNSSEVDSSVDGDREEDQDAKPEDGDIDSTPTDGDSSELDKIDAQTELDGDSNVDGDTDLEKEVEIVDGDSMPDGDIEIDDDDDGIENDNCQPDCSNHVCGYDPNCGALCGVCPEHKYCEEGECVSQDVICGDMSGLDAENSWPMMGYCPTRAYRAPFSFPMNPTEVLNVEIDKESGDSSLISSSIDNIIIASEAFEKFGRIASYDIDGSSNWVFNLYDQYPLDDSYRSIMIPRSLSVRSDGIIIAGAYIGASYSGEEDKIFGISEGNWIAEAITSDLPTSSTILPNKTILLGSGGYTYWGGDLMFVSSDWADSYHLDYEDFGLESSGQVGPISVGRSGSMYSVIDDKLFSISTNELSIEWMMDDYRIDNFPVVGKDGTIYVVGKFQEAGYGSWKNYAAFDPDGNVKWFFDVNTEGKVLYETFTLGPNGTVYVSGMDTIDSVLYKVIYSLDLSGNVQWEYRVLGETFDSARHIADSNGNVLIPEQTDDGLQALVCISATGKLLWRYYDLPNGEIQNQDSMILLPGNRIALIVGERLVVIGENSK